MPGPRLRPSMAAAWVPTQSRHSSVRRHKAGSAGRRDREPRYCACCRALPARDGLVDDAPPSSGVCVDRVHRAAPSLRGGLVDIDALVRPLLCVKACADDLASESATRARGQSGFLHPRHQCDCKHGLYRPSFLVRSLGLNVQRRWSSLGTSAKRNIAAIKGITAVSHRDSPKVSLRQPVVALEPTCSPLA